MALPTIQPTRIAIKPISAWSTMATSAYSMHPPSAALYGRAAALGGCMLYALVAIVLHAEIGLIAILVGWMVGKAIRHGSYGRGGRPQQILAVALTYFAITTSYIPVILYQAARHPRRVEQRQQAQTNARPASPDAPAEMPEVSDKKGAMAAS